MAGKVGGANKPEMGLKAGLSESLAQASDAVGNATGSSILVRAFKTEDVKLHKVLFLRALNTFSPIITCLGDFLKRTSIKAIASPTAGALRGRSGSTTAFAERRLSTPPDRALPARCRRRIPRW